MSPVVVPLVVVLIGAFVVPALVTAAVERGDRRRAREATAPGPVPDGAGTGVLFTVRPRRWQRVLIRVVGLLFVVVGGFFGLVVVVALADPDGMPGGVGAVVTPFVILLAGAGFLLLARSLARTRLDVLADRVLVRRGFRAARVVPLADVTEVLPLANQYGGVLARGADGRALFWSVTIDEHHGELLDHLAARAPHLPWVPRRAPLVADDGAVGPDGLPPSARW